MSAVLVRASRGLRALFLSSAFAASPAALCAQTFQLSAADLADSAALTQSMPRLAAVVRVDAEGWIDYLSLAKWNGEWRIVNVLWELRPRSDSSR